MRFLLVTIMAAALATGCVHYPKTNVRVTDDRPSISVTGAPADASVYVDGLFMGTAGDYDGRKKVLQLESGTHEIEIKSGGATVYSETVYLGEGTTKDISVSGGGH